MLAPELLAAVYLWCSVYKVEPPFALAVMKMESGFKCGPLGRHGTFIGPGGIHKQFRAKWAIDDPKENIRVTIAALEGRDKVRVLKRYNKTWWKDNYLRDTLSTYRQYARRMPE